MVMTKVSMASSKHPVVTAHLDPDPSLWRWLVNLTISPASDPAGTWTAS